MNRAKDEADFWAFVQNRSGELRRLARTLTTDQQRADDLVREALERAWLAWRRLDDTDPFAWTRRALLKQGQPLPGGSEAGPAEPLDGNLVLHDAIRRRSRRTALRLAGGAGAVLALGGTAAALLNRPEDHSAPVIEPIPEPSDPTAEPSTPSPTPSQRVTAPDWPTEPAAGVRYRAIGDLAVTVSGSGWVSSSLIDGSPVGKGTWHDQSLPKDPLAGLSHTSANADGVMSFAAVVPHRLREVSLHTEFGPRYLSVNYRSLYPVLKPGEMVCWTHRYVPSHGRFLLNVNDGDELVTVRFAP